MDEADITSLHAKAQNALNKGDLETAYRLCVEIVRARPDHSDAHFLLGIIASAVGQIEKSIQLIEKAISCDGSSAEYYAHYAKILFLSSRFSESRNALDRSIELPHKEALTCDTIGTLLCKFGKFRDSIEFFEKAISLKSEVPNFHFNLGATHKALGSFGLAKQSYSEAVALQPGFIAAHAALSEIGGASDATDRIENLKQHLGKQPENVNDELMLCHALAMEYASIGDHNESFAYLKRGNMRKAGSVAYDPEEDNQLFEAVRSLRLNSQTGKRQPEQTPIFIVGMPRSGTTVVDRILSNHSQVTSAGELQVLPLAARKATQYRGKRLIDFETLNRMTDVNLQDLGDEYLSESGAFVHEKTPFFTDKFHLNFWYLPLIVEAMPEAKIVCLTRNPLDVCFGNYKTLFSLSVPWYDYSFDLMNTARYVCNFNSLFDFLRNKFEGQLHFVEYEKLVEAPEKQIKGLLEYCGLPWEQVCMDIQSNTSPVATASAVQVRQPINADSIGRWKNYRTYMREVERYFNEKVS